MTERILADFAQSLADRLALDPTTAAALRHDAICVRYAEAPRDIERAGARLQATVNAAIHRWGFQYGAPPAFDEPEPYLPPLNIVRNAPVTAECLPRQNAHVGDASRHDCADGSYTKRGLCGAKQRHARTVKPADRGAPHAL